MIILPRTYATVPKVDMLPRRGVLPDSLPLTKFSLKFLHISGVLTNFVLSLYIRIFKHYIFNLNRLRKINDMHTVI